jgi:Rod binding domain-containing protein
MNALPATLLDAQSAIAARGRPPVPVRTDDPATAREAAEEFEAFFLSQVLDGMFKGIKSDGMFGGGSAEAAIRPMLLQEYGKLLAQRGGIGLADAVMRELLITQEVGP